MEYGLPPSCTPAHRTWGLYWEGIPTVNQIKSSIPPVALIASKHFLSSADGLLRQQPLHVDVHQSCPTSTSDLHPVLSACLAELQQLCQVCHSLRLIYRCCRPPPPTPVCFMIRLSMKKGPAVVPVTRFLRAARRSLPSRSSCDLLHFFAAKSCGEGSSSG